MADQELRRAPRVPPSPNSMAGRAAAGIPVQDVLGRCWLADWRKLGGSAAVIKQISGALDFLVAHAFEGGGVQHRLAMLAELKDPTLTRQVMNELIAEGVFEVAQ